MEHLNKSGTRLKEASAGYTASVDLNMREWIMRSLVKSFVLMAAVLFMLVANTGWCGTPTVMNYQGCLTDSAGLTVKDSTYTIIFKIYSTLSGPSELWSETHTDVSTEQGLFAVELGSITPLSESEFSEADRWLGIAVDPDPEMTPRTHLVATPYAFRVATVDGATGGTISGDVELESDLFISSGKLLLNAGAEGHNVGIAQHVYGETHSLELLTGDEDGDQATRMIIRGDMDSTNIEFLRGVAGSETPFVFFEGVSGFVGIGDTTPSAELDVNGEIRMAAFNMPDGASNGYVLTSDASGNGTWHPGSGDSGGWHDDGTVVRLDEATDKVGIGTTDPSTKLHVTGGAITAERVHFEGGGTSQLNYALSWLGIRGAGSDQNHGGVYVGDSTTDLSVILRARTSDANSAITIQKKAYAQPPIAYFRGDGKVGIGTETPGDLLEVVGANGSGITITGDPGTTAPFVTIDNPDNGNPTVLTARDGYAFNVEYPENTKILSVGTDGMVDVEELTAEQTVFASSISSKTSDDGLYLQTEETTRVYIDETDGSVWMGSPLPTSAYDAQLHIRGGIHLHNQSSNDIQCIIYPYNSSGGTVKLFGPNGTKNIELGGKFGDYSDGQVDVCDDGGTARAGFKINSSNEGIIWGDHLQTKKSNPRDPDTELWYSCPEGPEAAAYVRGTAKLIEGRAEVNLPEYFVSIASSRRVTVQVTPLSSTSKGLAVTEKGPDRFVVEELYEGEGNYEFDYTVMAVRKGMEDYKVIRPKAESVAASSIQPNGNPEDRDTKTEHQTGR